MSLYYEVCVAVTPSVLSIGRIPPYCSCGGNTCYKKALLQQTVEAGLEKYTVNNY
jgi:hypothetical protein